MSAYGAIPTLSYKDADAAIEFLKTTLGFEEHAVYRDAENKTMHAELTFGKAMIMLGTANNDTDFGKMTRTPEEVGGYNTQTPYIVVEDVDAHYERAKSKGAKIVKDIRDEDYGGRDYSCKDPEGYIWNFGSYDPFAAKG